MGNGLISGSTGLSAVNQTTTGKKRVNNGLTPEATRYYQSFRWDATITSSGLLNDGLERLLVECPELKREGLSVEEVNACLGDCTVLAGKVFDAIYPTSGGQLLHHLYHGNWHTVQTAKWAAQAFLGGLIKPEELPIRLPVHDIGKWFQVVIVAAALHELYDWWSISDGSIDFSARYESALGITTQSLTEAGLSTADLDCILTRYDSHADMTKATIGAEPALKHLPGNNQLRLLSAPESNETVSWACDLLHGADYCQLIDKNYLFPVDLAMPDGSSLKLCQGLVALAVEMLLLRPALLRQFGWADEKGEIVWRAVRTDPAFLQTALGWVEKIEPAIFALTGVDHKPQIDLARVFCR